MSCAGKDVKKDVDDLAGGLKGFAIYEDSFTRSRNHRYPKDTHSIDQQRPNLMFWHHFIRSEERRVGKECPV